MDLLLLFSWLGTISIFLAAILISSKKSSINPKLRIWAFSFYIGACIFLGIWGLLMNTLDGLIQTIQQVFLFFINLRGIYHARKELKDRKRDPFEVIVPKNFWEDILGDEESMEHDY